MNKKTFAILVFMMVSFGFIETHAVDQTVVGNASGILKVHLPREITIDDGNILLGYISVLSGEENLASKAAGVVLGRFVIPGQGVTIDRSTVISRLANSGIDRTKIQMTGAGKVLVMQTVNVVTRDEFTNFALKFLKTKIPDPASCIIEVKSLPSNLVIADLGKEVKLVAQLLNSRTLNRPRVRIIASVGGKEVRRTDISFLLRYNRRSIVAKTDILAGTVLTVDNIDIKKSVSDTPEPPNYKAPYGYVTKRNLAAKTVIKETMIKKPEKDFIVERNQTVVIKVDLPGFLITATGLAMQQGKSGDFIKVRNIDSQRIITVQVKADGTVRPIL